MFHTQILIHVNTTLLTYGSFGVLLKIIKAKLWPKVEIDPSVSKFWRRKAWQRRGKITIGSWNCFVGTQPQKAIAPHAMESTRLYNSKIKFFFFRSFFTMKFFTPKFMKLICYLRIFTNFGSKFQTKLITHNSILSYIFKSTNKL